MKPKAPKTYKVWMVKGSAAIAPFYGFSYTRKGLIEKMERAHVGLGHDAKIIRVTVSETE